MPRVQRDYNSSSDPERTALGGLSMGGMQTCNIGLTNLDKFHYLMPSSSAPGVMSNNQLFPDGGASARQNLKLILFTCGSADSLISNNIRVRDACIANNITTWKEWIVQGAGHTEAVWAPSFWNFAQLACAAGFTDENGSQPTSVPQGNTGDVNGDNNVNIVDALSIAQYYVGNPPSKFYQDRADTNCDGTISIVDALLVSQYYVGEISQFCR